MNEKLSTFNMELLKNGTRLATKDTIVYENYEYPNAEKFSYGFKISPIDIDNSSDIGKAIAEIVAKEHLIIIGTEIKNQKHELYGNSPKFAGDFGLISLESYNALKEHFIGDENLSLNDTGKEILENSSSKYINLIRETLESKGLKLDNKSFNMGAISQESYSVGQSFITKNSFPKFLKEAGLKEKTSIFEELTVYGTKNKDMILATLMENKFDDKVAIESHSIAPLGSESEVGKLSLGCTVYVLVPKTDLPSKEVEAEKAKAVEVTNDVSTPTIQDKPKNREQSFMNFG